MEARRRRCGRWPPRVRQLGGTLASAKPALIFFLTCAHWMATAGNFLERRLHQSGASGCTPRAPLALDHSPGATFLTRTHPGRLPGPPHTCRARIPHLTRTFSTRTCGQATGHTPYPRQPLQAVLARESACGGVGLCARVLDEGPEDLSSYACAHVYVVRRELSRPLVSARALVQSPWVRLSGRLSALGVHSS